MSDPRLPIHQQTRKPAPQVLDWVGTADRIGPDNEPAIERQQLSTEYADGKETLDAEAALAVAFDRGRRKLPLRYVYV